jgi:hypothetical protein
MGEGSNLFKYKGISRKRPFGNTQGRSLLYTKYHATCRLINTQNPAPDAAG